MRQSAGMSNEPRMSGPRSRGAARLGRTAAALVVQLLILLAGAPARAAPQLELVPPRLTFARQGESRTISLRNRGDAPLHLQALGFSADSAGFSAEQIAPRSLLPGEELAVAVHYERAGRRPQAFGALLVYSDDPRGFDDPRSAERDFVRSAALVAGESAATLWLWLPPLVAAGLLLARRRAAGRSRLALEWAGTLLPLAASLWLLRRFDPEFAVPQGNYGIQLGLHRVLWPAAGLELWTGVDGLSLPLLLLLALSAVLQLLLPAATAGDGAARPAARLLLHAGALLGLCSLDALWLLCGWELVLLGAWGWLKDLGGDPAGGAARSVRGWFIAAQTGAALMGVAIIVLQRHSLPTALADGTTAAHTTDLIKLGYANYFGDLTLAGVALDRLLWLLLLAGALLPVALLPLVGVPAAARLTLSLPLLVVGVYAVLRLAFYALPQAAVALSPWLIGAALSWSLGFSLRALRQKELASLLTAAVTARAGSVLVGLLCATQTGVQAALLQLWHHGLAVLLLALCARARPQGAAPRPPVPGSLFIAALLILDAPGLLGFVQRTLLVVGAFPELRAAAVGLAFISAIVPLAALRLGAAPREPGLEPRGAPRSDRRSLLLLTGLTAAAVGLGVFTQPLLAVSRGFVSDFVAHVFTRLDASAIAAIFP